METALDRLHGSHLWIIYPGEHMYPLNPKMTVWPLTEIAHLKEKLT